MRVGKTAVHSAADSCPAAGRQGSGVCSGNPSAAGRSPGNPSGKHPKAAGGGGIPGGTEIYAQSGKQIFSLVRRQPCPGLSDGPGRTPDRGLRRGDFPSGPNRGLSQYPFLVRPCCPGFSRGRRRPGRDSCFRRASRPGSTWTFSPACQSPRVWRWF